MKRSLAIFLCVITCSNSFSQAKSEANERERIAANKISKTFQWTHKYSQGKPNPKGYITTETTYDKKGNPVEIVNYRSTGQISSKLLYKYDAKNNKVEYIKYEKKEKPNIEVTFKQSFSYDEDGKKRVEVGFDGITGYRITYSYNPDGKTKEIIKYNSDNSVAERWQYLHPENVQTIKVYKPGTTFLQSMVRRYDVNGNLIEDGLFSASGKEINRTTYEYDSRNRMLSMSQYFSGVLAKTFTYRYNNQGLLVEVMLVNPDGSKLVQSIYKYDSRGNLTDEKWFDGVPNDLSSKLYQIDAKGNVVEIDSYYSDYQYKVLHKYTYEYH